MTEGVSMARLCLGNVSTPLPSNEGRDYSDGLSRSRRVGVSTPLPSNEGRDYNTPEAVAYNMGFQHLYLLTKVVTRIPSGSLRVTGWFQHLYLLTKVVTPPFKTLTPPDV